MKLFWLTDVHLEWLSSVRRVEFFRRIAASRPDALAISGDIGQADSVAGILTQLDLALGVPIYFVLGNHDYYDGSFAGVDRDIGALCRERPRLRFLDGETAPIALDDRTAIVGHSSWYDVRFGDEHTFMELNDFELIDDLAGLGRLKRTKVLRSRAARGAAHIERVLPAALSSAEHVFLVTHVPPFQEGALYDGRPSGVEFLPLFTCKIMGEVILAAAARHPDRKLTVLCGHTHHVAELSPLPNVQVHVGGARYDDPEIQKVFEL